MVKTTGNKQLSAIGLSNAFITALNGVLPNIKVCNVHVYAEGKQANVVIQEEEQFRQYIINVSDIEHPVLWDGIMKVSTMWTTFDCGKYMESALFFTLSEYMTVVEEALI